MNANVETDIAELTRERNLYKGKNASLLALLSKMRDRLGSITTEIEDEGDRAYFGSTNDADELKAFESDMIDWLVDAEVPHLTMTEDPYAEIRELRARAEKAEAYSDGLKKALEPFAQVDPMDVYETEDEDANGAYLLTQGDFLRARSALSTPEHPHV